MPQDMTLRFELFVKDPDRSVEFYTDALGFELVGASESYRSLHCDGVTIGIGQAEKLDDEHYFRPEITAARRGLGVEIVLQVNDVEELYKHAQEAGYPIHEALARRSWGLTDFRIVDPDGYYLRLSSRS